ncbi:MAG: dienelactone hydrolase family protein [Actinobacteria bacterium]|nr:dienelactone hydrolase family protein [Actinomycetota bacterium]
MCFELDSEPPVPRIAGAAVSHDDLVLHAEDGNRFAAFAATAEGPTDVGVVILPDVRGLYRFYEELALRFAERGYTAIAFDYFGRTAGVEKRPDDWEYMPHVQQTNQGTIQLDVGACVNHLRALDCSSLFAVGFCFGGSAAWASTAYEHGLKGAVGFYGRPVRALEFVPHMKAPILALQAGDDANISHEDNLGLERALREAGVEHELVEYPGAPHSFFDRKQEQFADASEDAWRRTLEFVERHR